MRVVTAPRKFKNKGSPKRKPGDPVNFDLLEGEELKQALLARREELRQRVEAKNANVEKYENTHKIEFFKPIEPYQTKVLEYIHAGKKVVTMQGANGIGKTVMGAVLLGSACLGIQPWDKKDTIWGRKKVKCRTLCTDWEKHAAEVIVPKLKEWLPAGEYETKKNNVGVESMFKFRNGSTIELLTNKSETSDHEGWEGDVVWADEPLPRDKFVANLRGLRRPDGLGLFFLSMTAKTEPWILDEIILNEHPSYASVTQIDIEANPYLTKEYKETLEASLTDDEKLVRMRGGFLNLVGRIIHEFDKDKHWVEPFVIPVDWPVIAMIDLHNKKPQAISFYTFDPLGREFVIDEIWDHITSEEIANSIVRKKKQHVWNMTEAFIDPLAKGDSNYVKNRFAEVEDSFNVIERILIRHGINLSVASKDKDSGIKNIKAGFKGLNKMPSLFFFNTCKRHLYEIQRWIYDESGVPKKTNEGKEDYYDDFMENLYRSTLTGVKWMPPRNVAILQKRYDQQMQGAMV